MGHDVVSVRQRVNIMVDSETIAEARTLGINLSRTMDRALAAEVRMTRQERWREANRDAMTRWADWYEKEGDPLAHLDPL